MISDGTRIIGSGNNKHYQNKVSGTKTGIKLSK